MPVAGDPYPVTWAQWQERRGDRHGEPGGFCHLKRVCGATVAGVQAAP